MMSVLFVELLVVVVWVVTLLGPIVVVLRERGELGGAGALYLVNLQFGIIDRAKASCSGQIDIGRSWRFGRHGVSPLAAQAGSLLSASRAGDQFKSCAIEILIAQIRSSRSACQ